MRKFIPMKTSAISQGPVPETSRERPDVTVIESHNRIDISYTFPGFYLSDDSRKVREGEIAFKQVDMSGVGFVTQSGRPLLPSLGRFVQIPPGGYGVKVESEKTLEMDDVLVLPAQQKVVDGAYEHAFEFDRDFYKKDALYPPEIAEVKGPFTIGGWRALLLHVRPLQYNPARKKLIGYGNIRVSVTFSQSGNEEDTLKGMGPENDLLGNLFFNHKSKRDASHGKGEHDIRETSAAKKTPMMLIIFDSRLEPVPGHLASWRVMNDGMSCECKAVHTIGKDVAKIKEYIRMQMRFYETTDTPLRYVLLMGDVDMVPAETVPGGPWGSNITDYYYSTLADPSGPYDLQLPSVALGRIPVRTSKEAEDVLGKIFEYEKHPPYEPYDFDYFKRMTFAGFFQDDDMNGREDRAFLKTMEGIRSHLITLGYNVKRVYVTSNPNPRWYIDGTPVPMEVVASMVGGPAATNMLIDASTRGQLIVAHRDHGDWNGWVHPSFTTNHLDSLGGEARSIFFSVNCLTGMFDLASQRECFAEKLLRIQRGAPSLIAATRVSGTWRNDAMMKALFDALWPGVLPSYPGPGSPSQVESGRLGDILNYAKLYLLLASSGDPEGIKDHFEIYHVIGDPAIKVWTKAPWQIPKK